MRAGRPLIDEPLANKYFETLDALDAGVAERCTTLKREIIKATTAFHWWPKSVTAN
jgi:hypothetical protein